MFAYCCNRPNSQTDHSGKAAVSILQRSLEFALPVLGLLDSATPILEIAGLLVIGTITINEYSERKKEETISIAVPETSQQYQYWEAVRVGSRIHVGNGLTFSEARLHVASGLDIMCANQGAALWLVISNGYWNAVGPEIHGGAGYFWHYHPHRNSHIHIWYY